MAEAVVLAAVQDANDAMIALDDELGQLLRDQVRGELRVVRHGATMPMHTLLRESLSRAAFPS